MEVFRAKLFLLKRAGWEIKVDAEDLTDFVAHLPVRPAFTPEPERTLTIEKDGRVAAQFRVIDATFYGDVIVDLMEDLRRLEGG